MRVQRLRGIGVPFGIPALPLCHSRLVVNWSNKHPNLITIQAVLF